MKMIPLGRRRVKVLAMKSKLNLLMIQRRFKKIVKRETQRWILHSHRHPNKFRKPLRKGIE